MEHAASWGVEPGTFGVVPRAGATPPATMPQPYRSDLAKTFAQYRQKTGQVMDLGPFQSYFTAQMVGDLLRGVGSHASLATFEHYMGTHVLQTDM